MSARNAVLWIAAALLTLCGCHRTVFLAEQAYVNGGRPGEGPSFAPLSRADLDIQPT